MFQRKTLLVFFSLACFLPWMQAADPISTELVSKQNADSGSHLKFFEQRIRPLLIERCYECHSEESAEGGLRLDLADSLHEGGDSGPAVIAGDLDESLLVSAVRYDGLEMPPDEPLSDAEIADIERWVKEGATWPIQDSDSQKDLDATSQIKDWWAAQPIDPGNVPAQVPAVKSTSSIDRYIDSRLSEAGLHRAPVASRVQLIRRLSYDLLGLPPTPEAIEAFIQDRSPMAYQRLVDRLFADPAYGERMGRLWLDLVRYAESDGYRADAYRPAAWRYRQFVVDAFNGKLPYDQFMAWQVAGDELDPSNEDALAAVGFLRQGIYEYNQRDAEGQWEVIVDELTDVTADVFLSTGLACAKCHDHKFDPIPRADYFHLRSVFEPIEFVDSIPTPRDPTPEEQAKIDQLLDQLQAVEGTGVQELGDYAVSRFPDSIQAAYHKPASERNSYEQQMAYLVARQVLEEGLQPAKVKKKIGEEAFNERTRILNELDKLNANPYGTVAMMTVRDCAGEVRPTRLPGRSSGRDFEPAIPELFGGKPLEVQPPVDAPISTGRRSALARWMASKENPITPRVMVNRLWQYHFQTGLVSSPNDFGRLGTPPTHPQLLDHLAEMLIDHDWNLQTVQRAIVCSDAYRQSSVHPQAATAEVADPDNRLLWHWPVRRLDAEQYRDSLLIAMRRLIDELGVPSFAGTEGRRSLYMRRYRNKSDEMLGSLDVPTGVVGMPKRDVTTTAPQSLMMLNNARILGVANRFRDRVVEDLSAAQPADWDTAFVRHAHQILTGQQADDATASLLTPLVAEGKQGQVDACHILLNSNAFLFID